MVLFKNTRAKKILTQYRLEVKSDINALDEVLNWFIQVVERRLPRKCGWQCQLALAEAFTNTVRYAHKDLPESTPISIELNFLPNTVEIRIYDYGQPFDLRGKLRSLQLMNEDLLERESDRGLLFIQKLTDNVESLRLSGNLNCLIMRKMVINLKP